MDWEILIQSKKNEFLQRAKNLIDKGFYSGFEIEELAKMLYESHYKHS